MLRYQRYLTLSKQIIYTVSGRQCLRSSIQTEWTHRNVSDVRDCLGMRDDSDAVALCCAAFAIGYTATSVDHIPENDHNNVINDENTSSKTSRHIRKQTKKNSQKPVREPKK